MFYLTVISVMSGPDMSFIRFRLKNPTFFDPCSSVTHHARFVAAIGTLSSIGAEMSFARFLLKNPS